MRITATNPASLRSIGATRTIPSVTVKKEGPSWVMVTSVIGGGVPSSRGGSQLSKISETMSRILSVAVPV